VFATFFEYSSVMAEVKNLFDLYTMTLAFQSASFAILFNSEVVQKLYNKIDKKTKLTLKHVLKNHYKNSFNCLLISIIYVIVSGFSKNLNLQFLQELNDNALSGLFNKCRMLNASAIIYLFIRNTYLLLLCNKFLYKIFVKEATDEV
jgi:hypothetical protein